MTPCIPVKVSRRFGGTYLFQFLGRWQAKRETSNPNIPFLLMYRRTDTDVIRDLEGNHVLFLN
jgi:hypothetical protein